MRMIPPVFAAVVAAGSIALSGCAADPRIDTTLSGAIPPEARYVRVDTTRYFGAPIADGTVEKCLARAGLTAGAPATVLVQLSRTVRPVRSRVEVGGDDAPAKTSRASRSTRPREELVLGVSDVATGAMLLRASAGRVLPRGRPTPQDDALGQAVCAAILSPAAG